MFTFVAVVQVLSVALHPASRRRGYFMFSSAQPWPMIEVFHPGGVRRFTAHERGHLGRCVRHPAGRPSLPFLSPAMCRRLRKKRREEPADKMPAGASSEGSVPHKCLCWTDPLNFEWN